MPEPLPTQYAPPQIEERWSSFWLREGTFHTGPDARKPFTIMIPPPNVTGILHMGHGLNNTYQDVLIRWRRMQGYNALWVPGTDHASIATHNVVEKDLAREGITRYSLGREKFLERTWKWKEEYGGTIIRQLKRMGCSCDWDRERFTMDEGLSRAVREAFVRLFDEGLIYRGRYTVNWCPRCGTALSDDEVDHDQRQGSLWFIKYPFKDGSGSVTVATTRPETMLGDTAVAVSPADPRYAQLVGKILILPVIGREIPLVADEFVDPAFGTGAVKVTPAHDPNDFAIAGRHNLPFVTVIAADGSMTGDAGEYAGTDRFECRKLLVSRLEKEGLLEKVEPYTYSVGQCYRCQTVIEPHLSDQWFMRMKEVAAAAVKATDDGRVRFHPERWTRVFLSWLENIRDWCISRQLWWGHRIPVWYCDRCGEVFAARTDPTQCRKCASAEIRQDEDILDTWFSSALWPFSTLGWPDETPDLKYYYPTDVLVTDRGIIFFWVARMVMLGLKFCGEVPFRDIYINATVLDEQGRKMSKSLGNGIDPIEVIEQYGADAMRYSLVLLTAEGQDVKLSPTRFEMGRNFANKLWNAARFALINLDGAEDFSPLKPSDLAFEDRWILDELSKTVSRLTEALEGYHFHAAGQIVYHFAWNSLCDWYLEAVKPRLYGDRVAQKRVARQVLATALDGLLRMLHPFVPFITQELWSHLGGLVPKRGVFEIREPGGSLALEEWPRAEWYPRDEEAAASMPLVTDLIRAVRNIRSKLGLGERTEVDCVITGGAEELLAAVRRYDYFLKDLGRIKTLSAAAGLQKPRPASSEVIGGLDVYVPLAGLIDFAQERARLEARIKKAQAALAAVEAKLANPNFADRAPADVVAHERARRDEMLAEVARLRANLADLEE